MNQDKSQNDDVQPQTEHDFHYKILAFKAIQNFVNDLNNEFEKKVKEVALYNRILEKTSIDEMKFIDRHINAFHTFYKQNPSFIKDLTLTNGIIRYSDNIYLNLSKILKKVNEESKQVVLSHMKTIFMHLNFNTEEGRQMIETMLSNSASTTTNADDSSHLDPNEIFNDLQLPENSEGDFLKETLGEMVTNIDPSNPMGSVMGMMQGGFFNNFMDNLKTKMDSGELNMNNLMSSVTSMINTNVNSDDIQNMDPMMKNMLQSTLSSLGSSYGDDKNLEEFQKKFNPKN